MLLYLPMSICKIAHIHPNIQIPNPVIIPSGVFNHDSNFSSLHHIDIAAADRENATLKYLPLSISAFNTINFFVIYLYHIWGLYTIFSIHHINQNAFPTIFYI